MKKKIVALSLIAICLLSCAGGTLAYFTATQSVQNVITAGNVKVAMDGTVVGFSSLPIMPGTSVDKNVLVRNVGDNACWVRISVTTAITFAAGVDGTPDTSLVHYYFDAAQWTKAGGYYYYNAMLIPGEATTDLFSSVSFDPAMGNIYQNSTMRYDIMIEAVQVAHNGNSPFEALGWPQA